MAKRGKPKTKIASSRRRVVAPRSRLPAKPADTLDLARCEQFLIHEARLLDESKFDGWLALFTVRRLVLGAERAEPGQSARHRVADV